MRKAERFFLVVCILTLIVLGYKSFFEKPKFDLGSHNYTFRAATEEEAETFDFMGAQICHVYDTMDYEHDLAMAYGQVRTLFGEPAYTTKDLENLYAYNIIATDKNGKEIYIYIYNGPTGPAIGGDTNDAEAAAAAKELVKVIQNAEPTDFSCEAFYLDGPTKLTIAVKNGIPMVTEVPIGEDEFEDVFSELYGDYEF
jgi:hypothetical protein